MQLIAVFLLFFGLGFWLIPLIRDYAVRKKFVDTPDHRKVHKALIPALGGVAVFICFVLSFVYCWEQINSRNIWILFAGSAIVITGIIDDIKPQKAILKLGIQILSAIAVVCLGDYRLYSMSGTFGIYELHYWLSILISIFILITLVNAQNLIDGINGLASSLGILFFAFFAYTYFHAGNTLFLVISLSFIGSLFAFLRYNLIKPTIFLGDTGSTLIGFVSAVFLIDFLNFPDAAKRELGIINPYGILLSLFSIPLFDTFRVACLRLLKQKSPFSPDKTHIHHLFLRLDFQHYHITGILILANMIIVTIALIFQRQLGDTLIISFLLGLFVFGFFILEFFIAKKFKMRYDEQLTLEKFRNFIADYWYLFFSIIVFVLPFQRWATSIPILVYTFFWLFSFDNRKVNLRDMSKFYILVPSSLFFVSIFYYFIVEFNIHKALDNVLRYLPFLLFPLFLFLKKEYFSLKKWHSILAFFLIGILTFSFILFGIVLIKYVSGFRSDIFIQNESIISNIPTIYYSLLLCFAAMVTMYLRKSSIKILQVPTISFLILTFLTAIMILIHSKVGFIALVLILSFGGLIQWIQNKRIQPSLIVLFFALSYTFIFIYKSEKIDFGYLQSSSIEVTKRITQWQHALTMIEQNPVLGYGSQYLRLLNLTASDLLNCHNQYLESWIEFGFVGLLGLIMSFSLSLYQAFRSQDYFYMGYIFLIAYYSLFESLFTNQTGIIFFSVFNSLFLLKTRLRIKTIDKQR
jgi:UDP-GlcNAc:undecaprenyl-phosphate/decaprenyl-phosphate GlcNAc-1-phosphate transferase